MDSVGEEEERIKGKTTTRTTIWRGSDTFKWVLTRDTQQRGDDRGGKGERERPTDVNSKVTKKKKKKEEREWTTRPSERASDHRGGRSVGRLVVSAVCEHLVASSSSPLQNIFFL